MNLDKRELSVGELARRTGVSVSNLRAWERRHGFPIPERLPGGHRRYTELDVAAVLGVRRQRTEGVSLSVALASARRQGQIPRSSIMWTVRHLLGAGTSELTKPTLLALTRAVEDEAASRADEPVLVGAFQRDRFWSESQVRWAELRRSARSTIVFAMPGPASEHQPGVTALEADHPMAREWAVICDSSSFSACVVGTELPPLGRTDPFRRFEVLWTIDPVIVREAARTAVSLAASERPESAEILNRELDRVPVAAGGAVEHCAVITNRLLRELDRALTRTERTGIDPLPARDSTRSP